jgi:hypothetical protein
VTITQTAQVTFDALPTDAGNSSVATDASNVLANGTSSATITVTLLNAVDAPVVGHNVSLTQGGGSSTISAPSGPSDASGQVTFTVTNTTEETVTYTATDVTEGVVILNTAVVTFDPVPTGGGGGVIDVRVVASSDDAEERADRSMYRTSSDLEMVYDGGDQTVGMRFTGVAILRGASITNAHVQFQVDETPSATTSLTIQGQATDNAVTFGTSDGDISSRDRTGAAVSWAPPPWSNRGAAGADQRTPNLASIIQEIVNRGGWASGNALVIIITGTGERVAEAYDGESNAAPLLHVDFSVGSNTAPTASSVAITGTPEVGQLLTGNYTYGDGDGDAEGTSTYRWLRDGVEILGAAAPSYTVVPADQGALIVFEVAPVAVTGASPGVPAQSPAVGPVAAAPNSVPTASSVAITGTPEVGRLLTGSYTYGDGDGDAEGSSTYRWLRDGVEILGAAAPSYTLVAADQGALIVFEVTPVAATGASPGAAVASPAVGPVAAVVDAAAVSPNTVAAGSAIDVRITGSGFGQGASLTMENGTGGPPPDVSNVVVEDANTITATVTTKRGGPPRDRLWDVRVTNPDGASGVLVAGFTVTR